MSNLYWISTENNTMLFGILAAILVLVTGVLGENNNNNAESNCGSFDHFSTALSQCDLNNHFNASSFMADNTYHGYKILNTMAEVCSNYPQLRNCVTTITTLCPSLGPLLNNTAERYHNRLCTGTELSGWFQNAMKNDTELSATCVNNAVGDTFRQCRARNDASEQQNDDDTVTMLSSTERRVTKLFNCLRTKLSIRLLMDTNPMCKTMRGQDIMVLFYTYLTIGHELILPSNEEFEAFKKFVSSKPRRDWLPIFGGRR